MSAARKGRLLLTGLLAMFGLNGCEAFRDYSKNIREFPEPWKLLEPGTPRPRFPVPRVISDGGGPVIAPGDLVQLHIRTKFGRPEPRWQSDGNWWIWIGFRTDKETSFFSVEPRTASALVGIREGSTIEFVDANDGTGKDPDYAGVLKTNVFGDKDYYAWKKNVRDSVNIYASASSTPSTVEIKRVCKGQAKYRTVRLFDDSPVRTGSGFKTKATREPRELWIDEAKIEATCGDGRKAVFQYGPTGSKSGGKPRFVVTGYFDDWLYDAWKKLDVGVQFEGNRPPQAREDKFETQVDKPVRIDVLANDRDTEGNKLSARITKTPEHGKLADNPDGSWTYTPNPGWSGTDYFKYKASDGLVESAETLADVRVVKRD